MTANTPDPQDEPTPGAVPPPPPAGAVPPPPAPGYAPPPPPAGAVPPPPAPGYAPPPTAGYGAPQSAYPPPPAGYGAPQGAYPVYGVGAPLSDADQRLWAVVSHVGGVFVSFVVPLVLWLVFKGRGAFVEDQAKEALNFQITLAIAYLVGVITVVILVGVAILAAAGICAVVFGIIAAVKSSQGELYRYPINIRFVK